MTTARKLAKLTLVLAFLQGCGAPETTEPAELEEALSTSDPADLTSNCSCYGPGLYGNKTACGQVLRTDTIGVAHKTKACGTKLQFKGPTGWVAATVIDRGPFAAGREFDLTEGLVKKLGYKGCTAFGVRSVEWK